MALTEAAGGLPDWARNSVQALLDQLQQQAAETARLSAALKHAEAKNQALTLELAHLRRLRFGAKSEALSAEQRDLFQETLETDIAACEAEAEQAVPEAKPCAKRERAGRQPIPSHLPRIEHRFEPESCTCGHCGQDLVKIGEDISEQLDVEPARFFVHRNIRPQYACRACETITAAPIPAAIIDGGLAAPGLLAWVAIGKYADHLPLYRIEQMAARQQVVLSRSTLAEWMGRVGVALTPLADRLAELLKQSPVLHADETPVAQLDPGAGKTKRATLWAYHSNRLAAGPPIVVFDYQASRSGRHASDFLSGWQGHLMVDDYAGYKALFRSGATELACLAHARRKFFDLVVANQSPIAQEALARIGRLYAIEQAGRGLDAEARRALRQREAKPVLDALFTWLYATRQSLADGGATAKAIDYSLKRWEALIRYADSGDLPIDNNPVENAIRPIAIGKKNWLFAGSERAGKRAAAIQTLIGTARLNGLDPATWLRDTLEKLPAWPNNRIDELLPLRNTANS
ncbi:MAG: IS66 family transposase [Hydrogenophilales bacterium]|nr:IS66 family transposase [Hydrogenophilales bacterium]